MHYKFVLLLAHAKILSPIILNEAYENICFSWIQNLHCVIQYDRILIGMKCINLAENDVIWNNEIILKLRYGWTITTKHMLHWKPYMT